MQVKLSEKVDLRNGEYQKTAEILRLVYVNDTIPGIRRIKRGKGFSYYFGSRKIDNREELLRIKKLVIPPAWTNVWICPMYNGHLQATGYDALNRKQYKYHPMWSEVRNETKFHRLYAFGKRLPSIRQKVSRDMRKRTLTQDKVLALVVSLMDRTYIRIGNDDYQKMYGSYGLTTFNNRHVKIDGARIRFSFRGKKGITQNVRLKNKRLARVVQQCKDIPGKELFQYYDDKGNKCSIDSGMVNEYIKEAARADFTAKDFRTWAGTLNLLNELCRQDDNLPSQKKLLCALDEVGRKLGNTRAVCRKYYVHPGLVKMYEENQLEKYLKDLKKNGEDERPGELNHEEKTLMKILRKLLP